jgi:hypothetical protein
LDQFRQFVPGSVVAFVACLTSQPAVQQPEILLRMLLHLYQLMQVQQLDQHLI